MNQVKLITDYDAVRVGRACYGDDYQLLQSKSQVLHEAALALDSYVAGKVQGGWVFKKVEVDSILCGFILISNKEDEPIQYYFRKGKGLYFSIQVVTEILRNYPQAKVEKAKF